MKSCSQGHAFEGRRCAACHREYNRRWRAANLDRARATDRQRYGNPAKGRKEHSREAAARWRAKHPEQSRAVSLANKWAHIDRARASTRQHQRAHRDDYLEAQRRRRARQLAATVEPITAQQLEALLHEQHGQCHYCSDTLRPDKHLEHKVPLARGGSHSLSNLCWSCPTCNRRKGTKTNGEFVALEKCA